MSDERREVLHYIFTGKYWDDDWPPVQADKFIAWINEKLEKIPKKYRASAGIEIDSETEYDSHYSTMSISYLRPESDDEFERRKNDAASTIAIRRQYELETLAALQKKYGKAGCVDE